MLTNLEFMAYKQVVGFLGGAEQLADLRSWFDQNTWDCGVESSGLLSGLELALAEFSSGDRTIDELKVAFAAAIRNVGVLYAEPIVAGPLIACVATSSGTSARAASAPGISTLPGQFVGTLRETERA
jgi:hypothetical protein